MSLRARRSKRYYPHYPKYTIMERSITGIHHVTALAAGTQPNIDFYSGILGLRLVKQTVNFDAPEVHHLYYGNESGDPGTLLTFFPYEGLANGRHGKGMLNTTAFSVPAGSMDYWFNRLSRFGIAYKQPIERFGSELVVYLEDADGLGLELVFNDTDKRPGNKRGPIPEEHSIRGIFNVEIWDDHYERTAGLLTTLLDHVTVAEQGNRLRLAATDAPGNYLDFLYQPHSMKGLPGSGTVHHLALSTPGRESLTAVRNRVLSAREQVTPVLDRKYFSSVYFREPGGVLLEVATAVPGFTIDEPRDHLGEKLQLPEQFESRRVELEQILPSINNNHASFR